jgi:hypothetical protein
VKKKEKKKKKNYFANKIVQAWIFPLYFQLGYLPEETCFQQVGSSSALEPTSHHQPPARL